MDEVGQERKQGGRGGGLLLTLILPSSLFSLSLQSLAKKGLGRKEGFAPSVPELSR
jgi:hypothetical protein